MLKAPALLDSSTYLIIEPNDLPSINRYMFKRYLDIIRKQFSNLPNLFGLEYLFFISLCAQILSVHPLRADSNIPSLILLLPCPLLLSFICISYVFLFLLLTISFSSTLSSWEQNYFLFTFLSLHWKIHSRQSRKV